MRKNSVRKFIHAILDLLPLMVIPIFAIYSQNHEITGNEIVQETNKLVDFNQQLDITNYRNPNITYENINGIYNLNIDNTLDTTLLFRNNSTGSLIYGHKYYYPIDNSLGSNKIRIWTNNNFIGDFEVGKEIITYTRSTETMIGIKEIYIIGATTINQNFNLYINLFDLTQMFGAGNEPTAQEFRNYFPYDYYPYTASEEVVIENYETITYNDTDIMSQFMYVTYNACDKYFNMNEVFNLHGVWNWVSNTLFGGQPPISAFIVYNVIAYELIMDIIFLLYSVFMFIIDFAEKCLDRFMGRANRC